MTELGAEREQSTNKNAEFDQKIANLTLEKNMVYHFLLLYLLI